MKTDHDTLFERSLAEREHNGFTFVLVFWANAHKLLHEIVCRLALHREVQPAGALQRHPHQVAHFVCAGGRERKGEGKGEGRGRGEEARKRGREGESERGRESKSQGGKKKGRIEKRL